jgi:N-acetylmuramoyl-L-alanine amidase
MTRPDLVLGDAGDRVLQVTNYLLRINLLPAESSIFDRTVQEAVKEFQQSRGLTVTGTVDEVTLRTLDEARWKLGDRILSLVTPYMRGDDIAHLQSQLSEMGFNSGRVDGIFGSETEAAVMEFQKSVGVVVDGRCGPTTITSLMRLMRVVSGGTPRQLREAATRADRGPALAGKVIVLDPSDSSDIFDLAQRLEGRLIALGVNVFLTRNTHSQPSEFERIEMTNKSMADLVISINQDRYINDLAQGVATYYYGSDSHGVHSIVGERFATLVQREICARTDLLNCRTHAKTWDLLRLTKSPAVQISIGFQTNPRDVKRLGDAQFRETIVESLMVAIQRLYLTSEDDAKTGTLKVADLRRTGIRK